MYFCSNCNSTFTDPTVYIEKHGLDSPPYEKLNVCPYCNCSDIFETKKCDICGEVITGNYIKLSNDMIICSDCYTKKSIIEEN